jgi:hypothetical protein
MIPDDESMIRTPAEYRMRKRRKPRNPATLRALEALPFKPFGYEW